MYPFTWIRPPERRFGQNSQEDFMKLTTLLALGILTLNCLAIAAPAKGGGTIGTDRINLLYCMYNKHTNEIEKSTLVVNEQEKTLILNGDTYKLKEKFNNTKKDIRDFNEYLLDEEAPYLAKHVVSYVFETPGSETDVMKIDVVTAPNKNKWALLTGLIEIYLGSTKDCNK